MEVIIFDCANRQFYCTEDQSTFSISYQYVYCVANLGNDLLSTLTITVGSSSESYSWYEDEGLTNLPEDASGYGGSYFSRESDSNIFQCLDTNRNNNLDGEGSYNEYNINEITVSYEYTSKVDSTDSILVQISNFVDNHNYWFMIGKVSVRCLGALYLFVSDYFDF